MARMGSFGLGVVKGLSEAVERDILKDIEESKSGQRRFGDFQIRRKEAATDKYLKQLEEGEEALELFGSLTGGNWEHAAQLLKGVGGVSQAATMFPIIKSAIARGTPIEKLVGEAGFTPLDKTVPARSKQQLMEHFATLTLPELPKDVGEPTGWAKIFKQPSAADVIKRESAAMGLPTEAPERVGIITPATLDQTLLDPDAAREQKLKDLQLTKIELQNKKIEADTKGIEAQYKKVNAEVEHLDAQSRADLNLTNAQLRGTKIDADRTEYLLATARAQDPEKHKLFVQAQQAEILRTKAGSGRENHTTFLLQHNEELKISIATMEKDGRYGGPEHHEAIAKKDANDRVLGTYAKYLEGEEQANLLSKINVISAFNGVLETAFAQEELTFEQGFSDQISRVIEGDTLAVNRAYNSALASFRTTYSTLGAASVAYIGAQGAQLKRGEANYVAKQAREYLNAQSTKKNYDGKFAELYTNGKRLPNSQLVEGTLYHNPYLTKDNKRGGRARTLPYAVWSGNGWLMPSYKSEEPEE